jgi:hypothetical protein
MAQELIDKIRAAAQAKNVNPDVAVQIARNESSLNPSSKTNASSAAGLFGVIDSTWKQFGGQPGKKLNPDENIRVGVDVIASNTDFLRRNLGREPSPSEIYTAHFFGPAGARTILNAAPDTPVSSLFSAQVLEANPHLKGKTAEQARQWLSKKMSGTTPARARAQAQTPAPATAAPQPAVMEPPLGISASAAPRAGARAAPVAASAEDLGSGYKAALALAFLGDEDKDREVSDDELRARMNRIEDEEFAQQLADYKPVNALQDLEITALNPVKALQPVKMADGGEAKKDEPKHDSAMRVRGAARAALDKVVSLGMGPGMGANLGYNLYKHFSGKTPLEDLLRDARQANQPIDPTRDMEPMSTTGGLSGGMPPVRRSNGSPESGEVALTPEEIAAASRPATFNPQIARQGAAARALAAQRDVNTLPDPRTYAAVSGFLGQAPDQLGFSVFHPDLQGIKRAGEVGFAAGLVPAVAPVVAPVARAVGNAVGRGATALGMRTEKALEAPVTRTLERGGRSAEMLQALGAQPSFAVAPSQSIFQHLPSSQAPFVGRLDEFVANMSSPVQKDQFLGMIKGKFRDYDIERVQDALADVPGNAKIAPAELLNKVKSVFDPGRFNTSVSPPGKYGQNYQSTDNIYPGKPLGVIHLAQELPPEVRGTQVAANTLLTILDRARQGADNGVFSTNHQKRLIELAKNPGLPVSDEVKQRLSVLPSLYASAADDANSIRGIQTLLLNTEASPDFMPAVKRIKLEIRQTMPNLTDEQLTALAMPRAAEELYQRGYQKISELSRRYGVEEPDDFYPMKPDFNSRLQASNQTAAPAQLSRAQLDNVAREVNAGRLDPRVLESAMSYSTPTTLSSQEKAMREIRESQIKLIQREISRPFNNAFNSARKEVGYLMPYEGQHPTLKGSPLNPIAFSRFSEHTTNIPGIGKAEGIYVNELQSDLLEYLQSFGARGGSKEKDRAMAKQIEKQIADVNVKLRKASEEGKDSLVDSLSAERTSLMAKNETIYQRLQIADAAEKQGKPFPEFYLTQQPFAGTERSPQVLQQLMAKNAVVGAIQQGKRFVAFPGQESAQAQLYEKLPNNLKQVIKDLGPGFELRDVTLTTATGDPVMHRAIVWGPEAAARIQKKGVPFKSGGMVERKRTDNRAYL